MIRCLVLLLGVPFAASAAAITLDFEGFPDGSTVSNQYSGVTFSNTIVLTAGISLNEFEFPPHSGSNVASDNGGPISIDFATPVSSFGGFFTYAEPVTLQAFDASDQLVGSVVSAFLNNMALSGDPGSSPNEFLQLNFAGISSVIITGDPAGGSFTLDDATYSTGATSPSQTPEPTGMVLVGTGLLLVGFLRRHGLAWFVRLGVAVIILSATSYVAIAQSVGMPGLTPAAVNVNAPTTITVTSRITTANVISGSVNVQKLSSAGQVLAVVGTLHDDGFDPDLQAGDGIYSGSFMLNEAQTGSLGLKVSAAIKGSLLRVASDPVTLDILPPGIPTGPAAPDFSQVVTDATTGESFLGNEVIACFTTTTTLNSVVAIGNLFGGHIVGRFSGLGNCYQIALQPNGIGAIQAATSILKSRAEVTFAGTDDIISEFQAPSCSTFPTCIDGRNVGYNHLNLNEAHSLTTGANVTVAVLDGPVDVTNLVLNPVVAPPLASRIILGPRTAGPVVGKDASGHGTAIAGIVAATAPSSHIYAVTALNEHGQGSMSSLAVAIKAAVDFGASVINTSSGTEGLISGAKALIPFNPLGLAVTYSELHDSVLVAAAGNEQTSAPDFPAGYDSQNELSVGSTNGLDVRSSSSNFGPTVQIAAPGECIPTTYLSMQQAPSLGGCGFPPFGQIYASGTSAAAPFVAGTAALLRSLHPAWNAVQIVQRLKDSAKPINPNPTTTTGGNSSCAVPSAPCPIDRSYNQQLGAGLIDPVNALFNCTLTLTATLDPGAPPGSVPPEFSSMAPIAGIFRYNSALSAQSGFCNSQGCSFLGSFEISAGPHVWKGQSAISAGQLVYNFDSFGSFNVSSSLSSDALFRLYDFDWQFQGASYPLSLLTNKTVLDSSGLKIFQAHLSAPGNPDATFSSIFISGKVQSTTLNCANP